MPTPAQPLAIGPRENEPNPPPQAQQTDADDPFKNFTMTATKWRFSPRNPCSLVRPPISQVAQHAAGLFSGAYDRDPLCHYLVGDYTNDDIRGHLVPYWTAIVGAALLQGATIYEANQWTTAAIVFDPKRAIDDVAIWSPCARRKFKDVWKTLDDGARGRLMKGYCPKSRSMREIAVGNRGAFTIFAIATTHGRQSQGFGRTMITRFQGIAYARNVPLYVEATVPSVRETLLSVGFAHAREDRIGVGECTEDGKFRRNEPLVGVRLWGMIWQPEVGPWTFIPRPLNNDQQAPESSDSKAPTPPKPIPENGAKIIPLAGPPAKADSEEESGTDPKASTGADEEEHLPTGQLELDSDRLLEPAASQAIESTSSIEPAPIKREYAKPLKTREKQDTTGFTQPGPSRSKAGFEPIPEEEGPISPEISKADRETIFPDKGLEQELFGKGDNANVKDTRGKQKTPFEGVVITEALGDTQKLSGEQAEDERQTEESDDKSSLEGKEREGTHTEDVGEEDIRSRKSVEKEIDKLR
ncbi:hypothetical protein BJX64DRAFT_291175 [Aspergillus heterothallicus]